MPTQALKAFATAVGLASCVATATALVALYHNDLPSQHQANRTSEAQQRTKNEAGNAPPYPIFQNARANEYEQNAAKSSADSEKKDIDIIAILTSLFTAGAFVVYGIQASLMRKTMVVSNRPYVNVVRIIASPVRKDNEGQITHWRFAPQIENAGNTPILRAVGATYSRISNRKIEEITFDYPRESAGNRIWTSPISLGPKATVPGINVAISVEELFDIWSDLKHFYIWGWIDYNDRFFWTKRRRTEFANEIAVISYPRDEKVYPFRTPRLWHHNGADEDSFRHPTSYDAALRGELGPIRKQYRPTAS